MLDTLITGAVVLDGSGDAPRRADVGLKDGRIVAVDEPGAVDEAATEHIEADGLMVCPGFVDPHTHYDAQLLWDGGASPSGEHGVTTVVGGNCSFGLAPLDPADAAYTRRLLAKVEGMPDEALAAGGDWAWDSFESYLARFEGKLAVNAAFLVGHSTLRRLVLGDEANERSATPAELDRLRARLAEALADGALGLSLDVSDFHSDGDGRPVPARGADVDELLALCRTVGEHPGTTLEGIFSGASAGFDRAEAELVASLSVAAGRPLNWNLLVVDATAPERIEAHMLPSRIARERGGRVVALTMPTIVPMNMSFGTYCALNLLPGWGEVLGLPVPERMAALTDPAVRQRMQASITGDLGMFTRLLDWAATASVTPSATPTATSAGGRWPRSPPSAAWPASTACSTSCWPTTCAPCCGPRPPTTTTCTGRCAESSGVTPTCSWGAATPAPTSIGCAAGPTPPSSWPTRCEAGAWCRWRKRCAC